MAMVGVDSGSLQVDSQPKSLGLVVGGHLVLFYILQIFFFSYACHLP